MSILVKGMKMPKTCNECPLHVYEGQGICSCRILKTIEDGEELKPWKKKRKDCPLIDIPPHGRLIDVDALVKKIWLRHYTVLHTGESIPSDWMLSGEYIVGAPTVLEAEE